MKRLRFSQACWRDTPLHARNPYFQGAGRMVSPTKLNRSLSSQSQTGGGPGGANGHSVVGGGTHLVGTPGTPVPSGSRVNGFLTPTTPAATGGTPLRSHASAADKPGGPPIKGKNTASKLTCTTLGNFLCTCLHLLKYFHGCSQPLVVVWTEGAD